MAGSDLPSGGSGATSPPPRAPPKEPAKRKHGDSAGPPSLSGRSTRSSAAARKATVGAARMAGRAVGMARQAVRMARRAAVGTLWTENAGRGRGRGFRDVERMQAVIIGVRLARSLGVPDDHPESPFPKECLNCKIGYLSSYEKKKRVGIDPVKHQASVPKWKDKPSDEESNDYKAESLPKLGTIVLPPKKDTSATDEAEKKRKEWVDNCNCSHPGSEDCVQVHINKARSWIKEQLGQEAFKNCGLDVMGEQVGELWTAVEKKKLEDVEKLIPQNKHQRFMDIALKELSQEETKDLAKETKDLAKYYHNVFLPRSLASLTRAEHKKDEAIDTDGEKSSEDDENNEHRPRKKSRSSQSSSSTRCKKYKSQKK